MRSDIVPGGIFPNYEGRVGSAWLVAKLMACFGLHPALRFSGQRPSVEILHHHDPLVVEVQLRGQNGFSVGRYRQALSLTVKGRD
jgi:hypothetical protein